MTATDGFVGKLPSPFTYSTTHQEYQWVVWFSLNQLRQLLRERRAEYGAVADAYVPWHRDIVLQVVNVQLYSCVTAEAVINFWATVRLGTRGLARIEQKGLESKLCAVVRRILSIELPEDHEARLAVKRLVATRNALVHPKPVIGGPNDYVPPSESPPGLTEAEVAHADMQRVLKFVVESDDDMWSFLI